MGAYRKPIRGENSPFDLTQTAPDKDRFGDPDYDAFNNPAEFQRARREVRQQESGIRDAYQSGVEEGKQQAIFKDVKEGVKAELKSRAQRKQTAKTFQARANYFNKLSRMAKGKKRR